MNETGKFAFLRRKARESAATRFSRKELAQVTLLKGAHQETIAPLLRDCPVKVLASGEVLLRAEEPCKALHIVLSGRLRLEDTPAKAPDAFIRAGDCIGELFLLSKSTTASTVSAAEATRILVVDRNTAWALIRTSHEIARNWLTLLADRTDISGIVGAAVELTTSHGPQSTHDETTGLYNRRWLEAMLPRQIVRSTSEDTPLSVLLAEIDNFSDYVERYGAIAGDEACRAAAKRLATSVRPTDHVVYYGVAQFVVVLPNADIAGACFAGERVRQAINRAGTHASDANGLPALTVSVGATQHKPPADAWALLSAAEAALHAAKNSGGNRVGMQ